MKAKSLSFLDHFLLEELSEKQMRVLDGGKILDQIQYAYNKLQSYIQAHPFEAVTLMSGFLLTAMSLSLREYAENKTLRENLKDFKNTLHVRIENCVREEVEKQLSVYENPAQQKVFFTGTFQEVLQERKDLVQEDFQAIEGKVNSCTLAEADANKEMDVKITTLEVQINNHQKLLTRSGCMLTDFEKRADLIGRNSTQHLTRPSEAIKKLKTTLSLMDEDINGLAKDVKNSEAYIKLVEDKLLEKT